MTLSQYYSKTGRDGIGMYCKKKAMLGWRNVWSIISYHILFAQISKNYIKQYKSIREPEGARPRGRPKKTWREIVEKVCQAHKLNRGGMPWIIIADNGWLMTTIGVSGWMFFSGTGSPGLSWTVSREPQNGCLSVLLCTQLLYNLPLTIGISLLISRSWKQQGRGWITESPDLPCPSLPPWVQSSAVAPEFRLIQVLVGCLNLYNSVAQSPVSFTFYESQLYTLQFLVLSAEMPVMDAYACCQAANVTNVKKTNSELRMQEPTDSWTQAIRLWLSGGFEFLTSSLFVTTHVLVSEPWCIPTFFLKTVTVANLRNAHSITSLGSLSIAFFNPENQNRASFL